jgi:hypothetical protein
MDRPEYPPSVPPACSVCGAALVGRSCPAARRPGEVTLAAMAALVRLVTGRPMLHPLLQDLVGAGRIEP